MIEADANEVVTTMELDADDNGWDELISDLDTDYLEAFRSGNQMAIQDAAIELSVFGYEEEHLDRLESIVFHEIAEYHTYLEAPELFELDEIPPRPDVHPGLACYFDHAEE